MTQHHDAVESQHDRMPEIPALEILANMRLPGQVVITNQSSSHLWPLVSDHELDFNYDSSTMGGAIPLALGLALARPERKVMVVSGEGALLMSLGCLVTVAASGADNLTVVALDNSMYELTGGQKTAATVAGVNFAGLALAAGFPNATRHNELDSLHRHGPQELAASGPNFICLEVKASPQTLEEVEHGPLEPRMTALCNAIGV